MFSCSWNDTYCFNMFSEMLYHSKVLYAYKSRWHLFRSGISSLWSLLQRYQVRDCGVATMLCSASILTGKGWFHHLFFIRKSICYLCVYVSESILNHSIELRKYLFTHPVFTFPSLHFVNCAIPPIPSSSNIMALKDGQNDYQFLASTLCFPVKIVDDWFLSIGVNEKLWL